LKNLRKKFNRFCYVHRNKGIPNLMLYISIGNALVYIMTIFFRNPLLYELLCFDRGAILAGQVWRLFSYPLTYMGSNPFVFLLILVCYYSLGRAIENMWGTLRFNLFYFSGVVLMDAYCLLFGGNATVAYLNLSLFLAYATMYPNAHFLLFYIIPVKAWIFALVDLGITLLTVISLSIPYFFFPDNLFPLVALGNYFLFFGKDVLNVIPDTWQVNFRRLFRRKKAGPKGREKIVPFPSAGSYQATVATPKVDYTHRCTVCGRTDVTNPELEFRYCSRCNGYYCYCQDHIGNHTHIQ